MQPVSQASAAGFVLAGGRSSRMGTDKALASLGGKPLVQIAVAILAAAGVSVRIAGSRSSLEDFAEVIPDTFAEAGPLGGVHAGLSASLTEWNLFLPVDLPLMPASLPACLLQRAMLTGEPVTAVRLNGRLEPFPVVLRRSVLSGITKRLQAAQAACHAAWSSLPAEMASVLDAPDIEALVQTGQCCHPAGLPPVYWFQSANTPTELARIDRICSDLAGRNFSSNLRA